MPPWKSKNGNSCRLCVYGIASLYERYPPRSPAEIAAQKEAGAAQKPGVKPSAGCETYRPAPAGGEAGAAAQEAMIEPGRLSKREQNSVAIWSSEPSALRRSLKP